MDSTENSLISNSFNVYNGQMLWALSSIYPYWPSIVCDSDIGDMQEADQLVQVRFCANKGKSCWVKRKNVFEFNGIESFKEKKNSMKSKLSKDEFEKAFDAENNEEWRKAVIEGTLIMCKVLEQRMAFFEIAIIHTLQQNCKRPTSLPDMILEHCSRSQRQVVADIVKENPNICEDLKEEFNRITQSINFINKNRRYSEPGRLSPQKPVKSTTRRSVPGRQLIDKKPATSVNSVSQEVDKKQAQIEKELMSYNMKLWGKNELFKNVRERFICKACFDLSKDDNAELVKCEGACGDQIHRKCFPNSNESVDDSLISITQPLTSSIQEKLIISHTPLVCNNCISSLTPVCYACKKVDSSQSSLLRCRLDDCGRYYHVKCLKDLSNTKIVSDKMLCPLHACRTCSSNDSNKLTVKSKYTSCIKCPTVYHTNSCCIPAGTIILTKNQHICISHRGKIRKQIRHNWCYHCRKKSDTLLSCCSCPKAIHESCLNVPEKPEKFLCHSCQKGQHPLYGDLVWTEHKEFAWWPAIVVPTFCIPDYVMDVSHDKHNFCVRFFGTYDFGWVERSKTSAFTEYDAISTAGKTRYDKAVLAARNWLKKLDVANEQPRPSHYVTINAIVPVAPAKLQIIDRYEKCSCTPNDPCESNCLNREILIECDPKRCPCGSKCMNQSFQRGLYPNVEVAFLGVRGHGLLAAQRILNGTLVIEYVGELITADEYHRRRSTKKRQNYYHMKYKKLYIDAEKKGNLARFVNHSCNANCEIQRWDVNGIERIGYFAKRNIEKGEEITIDYSFGEEGDVNKCFCGEKECNGFIGKTSSELS